MTELNNLNNLSTEELFEEYNRVALESGNDLDIVYSMQDWLQMQADNVAFEFNAYGATVDLISLIQNIDININDKYIYVATYNYDYKSADNLEELLSRADMIDFITDFTD